MSPGTCLGESNGHAEVEASETERAVSQESFSDSISTKEVERV